MAMQGIDVSGWQPGINIEVVPCDFAICKATEGTSFVSDDFYRQADQTRKAGKLLGVYHYINGAGAQAEMQHFYNTIRKYVGAALIVLDWEAGGNKAWGNLSYLDACIKHIKALTGKPVMVYASASCFPWETAKSNGCSTWVAQYANYNPTGYQANPWNEGLYTCDIRQYSSSGRLDGWSGSLDINKFYGDRNRWNQLAGIPVGMTTTNAEEPEVITNEDLDKIARKVWDYQIRDNTRYASDPKATEPAWNALSFAHADGAFNRANGPKRTWEYKIGDDQAAAHLYWAHKDGVYNRAKLNALEVAIKALAEAKDLDGDKLVEHINAQVDAAIADAFKDVEITLTTKE